MRRFRANQAEAAIPSLVWHELLFGCLRLARSRRREAIERYLEEVVSPSFPILDYDRAAAEWHASERARLEASGKPRPFIDGQIAAIAAVNDLTLVTSNISDFRAFRGLPVRSWS